MSAQSTPEQRAACKQAFEAGFSFDACAEAGGVSKATVGNWSKTDGWVRPEQSVEVRRARTAAARGESLVAWEDRRAGEADEAGRDAIVAREHAIAAVKAGDHRMARAAATVYGILIDKAQLLTGGATSRLALGGNDARDAARSAFDELASRRVA